MGTCHNCRLQVSINEFETKCDRCGTVINYPCNYCHEWFSIYDEKLKERRNECGVCGFFVCPECGTCGPDCAKDLWQTKINKILAPEITYSNIPNLQEKINAILHLIEEIKISHEQRVCSERGVSITYAKNRIKSCIVKTEGYRCKSESDIKKFRERIEEIGNVDLGTQLTINQSREDGSYGQEYRDVFNTCVCLGKLEKQKVKKDFDGEEKEIEVWRRVEEGQCKFLDLKDLIIKWCPKCKTSYPQETEECLKEECIVKRGKSLGQLRKLKLKISNRDICQLNRGLFIKEGDAKAEV